MRAPRREVLELRPQGDETTSRGNPRWWRYLLECGHVQLEQHAARHAVRSLAVVLAGADEVEPTRVGCRACAAGRPVSVGLICLRDLDLLAGRPARAEVLDGMEARGLNVSHLR